MANQTITPDVVNKLYRFRHCAPVVMILATSCMPQVDLPDFQPAEGRPGAGDGQYDAGTWAAAPDAGTTVPPSAAAPAPNGCDAIKTQNRVILQKNCASCHGAGASASAKFDYILDTKQLISSGKVVAGSPETSPIYKKMVSGEMPPKDPRPSDEDIAVVGEWIKCLAAPVAVDGGTSGPAAVPGTPGAPGVNARIETGLMLRWMADDISKIDSNDRPFTRYLTLTHLRNDGASETDLDLYRYAMAKAVNVLSQGTRVVPPVAIDKYKTVYRIDLRDYRWEARGQSRDKWEALVAGNPYAIEYLEDDAETLKLFAGTRVPFQGGDWLVNGATEGDLYNEMLNIPETRRELEQQLGIDIDQDIDRAEVWRAGFQDSGISLRNRMIERHENPQASSRTLWISYDFAGDGGRENIFSEPLDFQPDASEIIFSLPNGLNGYMVVDAAGRRIEVANDQIVVDPEQRDKNVHNGISCMGCHDVGTKYRGDELRSHVQNSSDFDFNTKEFVSRVHPAPDEFQALIDQDSEVFVASLSKVNPKKLGPEPIIQIFNRFENSVTLTRTAEELGISPTQLISGLGRLDPALASLAGGTVTREVFRQLFAETVCILNIGITNDAACRGNQ